MRAVSSQLRSWQRRGDFGPPANSASFFSAPAPHRVQRREKVRQEQVEVRHLMGSMERDGGGMGAAAVALGNDGTYPRTTHTNSRRPRAGRHAGRPLVPPPFPSSVDEQTASSHGGATKLTPANPHSYPMKHTHHVKRQVLPGRNGRAQAHNADAANDAGGRHDACGRWPTECVWMG